ncbi:MAG: T9SS type A sorting domain-containing protein [Crocinitomix sp.]|nr:T9SS type A sorting domain-containing protein [Crocinitomix sp.]
MKTILYFSIFLFFGQALFGQIGNDMHFDGVDDYVNLDAISSHIEDANDNFSIEFWCNYNGEDNYDYGVIFSANDSTGGNRFLIRAAGPIDDTDGIVIYINEFGENQYIRGDILVGDGRCHHIALTYEEGICSLYVDGVLDVTANRTIEFETGDLYSLGQEYDLGMITSDFYEGEIDEFRIWNKTISEVILNIFKDEELTGAEPYLIAYYNFNEGTPDGDNTGLTILDNGSVTLGLDGTLMNFELLGSTSNFTVADCIFISNDMAIEAAIIENEPQIQFINKLLELQIKAATQLLDTEIKIHDISGKIVFEAFFPSFEMESFDISHLNAGLYLVTVSNSENESVYKLLKQ